MCLPHILAPLKPLQRPSSHLKVWLLPLFYVSKIKHLHAQTHAPDHVAPFTSNLVLTETTEKTSTFRNRGTHVRRSLHVALQRHSPQETRGHLIPSLTIRVHTATISAPNLCVALATRRLSFRPEGSLPKIWYTRRVADRLRTTIYWEAD